MHTTYDYLGFGLGLRTPHIPYILKHKPSVDWFEIISENFMLNGGAALKNLDKIRSHYPVVMHGVSLNIGSTSKINMQYLTELKKLRDRVSPKWISDHLCWTGINGINSHDLLPLPYTEEVIEHVVSRLNVVQDILQQQILLENPSTYMTFANSTMPEWECISQIAKRSGCYLLLDVNNVYVSSVNNKYDPKTYINSLPAGCIKQIHLAGHTVHEDYIIDTHANHVADDVWELYLHTINKFGKISTMIEWDSSIPEFCVLVQELEKAKSIVHDKIECYI